MTENSEQDETLDKAEVEDKQAKVKEFLIENEGTLFTKEKIMGELDDIDRGDISPSQALKFPKPHYRVRSRSVGSKYYYYAEMDKFIISFTALCLVVTIIFIVLGVTGHL